MARKIRGLKNRSHRKDPDQLEEVELPKPKKEYRKFYSGMLSNGLEVLIINDKKSEYSQAALSVKVGAMMDPINLQGMAHFTEHMLFQGSEKYNQSESYFFQKVAQYQGGSNAFTNPFITNYYFRVKDKGFHEVLDIWAHFFISPQFNDKSILKELNAVNSEYEMKVNTQARTQSNVYKILIQKKHPMSKFTVGNFKSLLEEPLDDDVSLIKEMKHFFNQYYSANIMKLCIITKQDPFETYSTVKHSFEHIKNNHIQKEHVYYNDIKLFRNKSFLIKYQAKKEVKQLNIYFEIEYEYFKNFDKKSFNYITEVFNNKGPHSFKKYITENDFVYSFSCYLQDELDNQVILAFSFSLTEKGYDQIDSFIEMFYEYLDQLKQTEPDVNFYNYLKKKANLEFQMQDNIDDSLHFTSNMQFHNIKDILYSSYHYEQFDSHDIKNILTQIRIEKAQYTLGLDKFKFSKKITEKNKDLKHLHLSQKHKYHELPYEMIKDPFSRQEQHKSNISFSISYNDKYIPDDLETTQKSNEQDPDLGDDVITEVPKVIEQNNAKKVWYFDYQHEKQPYQIIRATISSTISYQNTTQKMLNMMLVNYMHKVYADQFSDINDMQSIYQVNFGSQFNGIEVSFRGPKGYSKTVIHDILSKLVSNEFTEAQYQLFKKKMYLSYQNFKFANAGSQMYEKLSYFIYKYYSLNLFKKQKLKSIDYQQFMNYKSEFTKDIFVEGFCLGQISEHECSEIFAGIDDKTHKIHIHQQTMVKLEKSKEIVLKNSIKTDNNHGIIYYIQHGEVNIEKQMMIKVFAKILRQNMFDYLRTQKQLGYMVSGSPQINQFGSQQSILGYSIAIVGVNTDVDNYEKEIKNVIQIIMDYIDKLEHDQFDKLKEGLIQDLKKPFDDVQDIFEYFWNKIDNGNYQFYKKNESIKAVRKIELEEVKQFMHQLFTKDNSIVLKLKNQKEFNSDDYNIQKGQLKDLRHKVYY